jgi:hypothetical protein
MLEITVDTKEKRVMKLSTLRKMDELQKRLKNTWTFKTDLHS